MKKTSTKATQQANLERNTWKLLNLAGYLLAGDLSDEQMKLLVPIIGKIAKDSVHKGCTLAIELMRTAPSHVTREQLADALEETLAELSES